MPGTELGSGDTSMERCSLCSRCSQSKSRNRHANKFTISASVEVFTKCSRNLEERKSTHLPGGDEGQLHRGGRHRAATRPVLENRPCRQVGRGRRGAKTQRPQQHFEGGPGDAVFLELKVRRETVAGWARQAGGYQILKSLSIVVRLFNAPVWSAHYVPGTRLSAGDYNREQGRHIWLSESLHSGDRQTKKKSTNK